jgi:hypothetical protein
MSKANIVFSASNIDLFQLCQARYDMRVNQNKELPILQKSRSLDMGGLAHEGLEVYFNQLKQGIHYNDRMQACLMKIREKSSDPETSNVNPEEINILLNAVEESCDLWRAEDENLIIHAVETPFDYVLFEDEYVRIIISGKIDLLCDIPPLARNSGFPNVPFDHKTYGREFPTYRLSNQFINYANACNSNYLIVNKIGLQKTLKPVEKHKRIPLSFDPLIIQQWKDNIISMILNQYMTCVTTGEWSMNFTSCFKFNRLCEFYEVCDSSGKDAKLFKLEHNFVEGKPWDKYKKEAEG